jgi:hypothetical protein
MIEMTYKQFTSPPFWLAFRNLLAIKHLSVETKLKLVRLDKMMKEEIDVARAALDKDNGITDALMSQRVEFAIELELNVNNVAKELSAADLINLQPLFTEEEQ